LARRLYSSSQFGLTAAIGKWKLSARGGRFTRAQQLTAGTAHFLLVLILCLFRRKPGVFSHIRLPSK